MAHGVKKSPIVQDENMRLSERLNKKDTAGWNRR